MMRRTQSSHGERGQLAAEYRAMRRSGRAHAARWMARLVRESVRRTAERIDAYLKNR